MLIPTIIMGGLAALLLYLAWTKGGGAHVTGLQAALKLTGQVLPLLFFAFVVASLITVIVPPHLIGQWVGAESGWRGVFIGAFVGALAPGGPFVSLPIALTLVRSGASIATMVAFLTGWSVWGINRLPLEVAVLGWKLTAIRLACSLILPPIAGTIAMVFFPAKTVI